MRALADRGAAAEVETVAARDLRRRLALSMRRENLLWFAMARRLPAPVLAVWQGRRGVSREQASGIWEGAMAAASRRAVLYRHLVAARFWIGEMLFLALVAGPYGRTLHPPAQAELVRSLARRSRPYAWTAIGVLLVTGVANLLLKGIGPAELFSWAFYRTPLGTALGRKLAVVALLLAGAAGHDAVLVERSACLGERLRREGPSPALLAEIESARRWAPWLGRANLALALVVGLVGTGLRLRA
ncbi:MAG: hypothetical protein K6V73_08045 [Firmicutes bacterium]|nr:hypothetical protein [Bacillota bacterium]